MEFSDAQLVNEAMNGSILAFEQLMARYERLVFKIALGCSGQRENALDIVQSVFLQVHRKLDRFRTDGNFRYWVARIAVNESLNWKRTQKRHQADELDETASIPTPPLQEASIRDREMWERIKRSMQLLKPMYRAAIALRYFEEMSIHEVANTLGCSDGTVKSMLFRSLKQMKLNIGVSKEVAL
jgi:RNA polymerase sigma-70 factor (ECF subfamily)